MNPAPNVEAARLEVAANLFSGRFSEVVAPATKLLAETDAPAIRHYLGMARYYLGDVQGARDMLASARRGGQLDVRAQATLASIEAAVGLRAGDHRGQLYGPSRRLQPRRDVRAARR